ncbi:MAG TPA: MbnP family copper-binding protein [Candidatus Margulisiibacteriota bacterium]|nr:MbnP family copper-binding protein [Candidatus Margulisiibacteriota bacterium]
MENIKIGRGAAGAVGFAMLLALIGCGGDGGDNGSTTSAMQAFSLRFAAVDGSHTVSCGTTMSGFGADQTDDVEISDLRFYVSDVQFFTADGRSLTVELDHNDFQYVSPDGTAALIDLTGTSVGACSGTGLSYPEGTARTNAALTGKVEMGQVDRVSFNIGLPQHLMKKVIAEHTAEDAPSPFAEMHWSWAFAYRYFVMNFVIADGAGEPGEGYVHVGSTDCGGDGTKALTDREACGKLNTPAVSLTGFDPAKNAVAVDIRKVLANVAFEMGSGDAAVPGVACHSSVEQPDCAMIFANFGLNQTTGGASAQLNTVFSMM